MSGKIKSENIVRHAGLVLPQQRWRLLGHKGCVVWLTGLSGSGKSTIASALEAQLCSQGRMEYVLDGDNVRHGLNSDLGFSPQDRDENIRRVGEVAALLADAGLITITAFISPYCQGRQGARQAAGAHPFIEVYLDVSLEVCRCRDPKGLYAKSKAGQLQGLTGVDAPYEIPESPELTLQAGQATVQECVDSILKELERRRVLTPE